MARKKKPLPLLENITITDIAAEGKAIAKVDGLAVFVPFVIPGDVVDLQIRRKNTVLQRLKPSTSTSIPPTAQNHSARTLEYAAVANGRFCHTNCNYTTSRNRLKKPCGELARWNCRKSTLFSEAGKHKNTETNWNLDSATKMADKRAGGLRRGV